MAICRDTKRKQYYITFKVKKDDGSFKTVNIRNAAWRSAGEGKVSLNYMRSIENGEISRKIREMKVADVRNSGITLGKLCEDFLENQRTKRRAESSIYAWNNHFKNYLFPVLGKDTPAVDCINVAGMEKVKAFLAKGNRLSASTINGNYSTFKALIDYARKTHRIDETAALEATDALERITGVDRSVERANYFFDPEKDIKAFFDTFKEKDREWLVPFEVLLFGGFRISEFLAIKGGYVDYENLTITVRGQIDKFGKEIPSTKGKKSRKVVLPAWLMEDLSKYADEMAIGEDEYLFQGLAGKPISHTSMQRFFVTHLEMAGLRRITLHGLRHTCASMLFEAGVPATVVQKQLGHSSLSTTLSYYIHATKSESELLFSKISRPK